GNEESRLLLFAQKELRRDLESRQERNRIIYDRRYSPDYFWAEQTAAFAKVADEVLAKHARSSASVQYIAEYLFTGLGRDSRAIEILFAAHPQKLLGEPGLLQLIGYLHATSRHGESIALLLPLVETRPVDLLVC